MKSDNSLNNRRTGIVLNFSTLIILNVIWHYCEINQWSTSLTILVVLALAATFLSFFPIYWRSGLWKFTHLPLEKLDEREMKVAGNSLRKAYAIFTVTILCLLLLFSLAEARVSIILVVSLIYFAHILPGAILGWKKKNILLN